MSLIPWRPFREFDRWFDEEPILFKRLENNLPSFQTPRVDIYKKDKNVIAEIEIPGVDPEKINVEVKDNVLKIEASQEKKKEKKEENYYKKEISSSRYQRMVRLPVEVVADKAEANYGDGVLKVVIPRKEIKEKKSKKIKVKVKDKKSK